MNPEEEQANNQISGLAANDHRRIGKELELFTFSDLVGSGLPIWLPRGATIRRILERFVTDTELAWGYDHVYTPDIAKLDLYKTSGHYPYYKDSMYAPLVIDEHAFMLRPMTCPHHFQLYADKPRSYRELPMRIAELAKLYRYESSGELAGLIRVRSFCLADAHIICKDNEQAGQEVHKALDLIEYISSVFSLQLGEDYWYRLSLGDRKDTEKYYQDDSAWEKSEELLRDVLKNRKGNFDEAEGEAAFYGPKIDIQMKDVRGKENTAFTVQYDFCMPDRFNLTYIDADGQEKRPIVIHRSSIGAIERVMAFLIEKYAGAFPLWLSPVQVTLLPVSEKFTSQTQTMAKILSENNIRVNVNADDESLGKRIRISKTEKVPYLVVIGEKEIESGNLTLEGREEEKVSVNSIHEVVEFLSKKIREKTL